MEFFFLSEPVDTTINFHDGSSVRVAVPKLEEQYLTAGNIPHSSIYCSTPACLENLAKTLMSNGKKSDIIRTFSKPVKKSIFETPNFPIIISNFNNLEDGGMDGTRRTIKNTDFVPLEEKIKTKLAKESFSIGVINGMGTGLGDSVMGIRALQILHDKLSQHFASVSITLYQTPYAFSSTKNSLYLQEKIVSNIVPLPVTLERMFTHDAIVDLSTMLNRENFNSVPMIDFFLGDFGIDPTAVPDADKQNFVKINEQVASRNALIFDTLKGSSLNGKIMLVHPVASVPARTVPTEVLKKIIKTIVTKTEYTVVIANTVSSDIKALKRYAGKDADRIVDVSAYAKTFDELSYAISRADYLLTVDTCTYHIANSFGIPAHVIFTNIEPSLRTKYYNNVESTLLCGQKTNKIWNKHVTYEPEDLKFAESLWQKLDCYELIQKVKKHAVASSAVICAICNAEIHTPPTDRHLQYRIYKCTSCESEVAFPRKAGDYNKMYATVSTDYNYQYYLAPGERSEIIQRFMNGWRFTDIKQFLEFNTKKGTLLDVGCANGFLPAFAEDLGYKSYGIDASTKAVEFAKDTMKLNDAAVCCDLSKLPEGFPETFDIITSFELVEHLEDPQAFAKQVYERLSPGGFWIFSTPNRNRIQFKMGVKNTGKHRGHDTGDYPCEHLTRFTSKGHKVLAENAGFDVYFQNTSTLSSTSIIDAIGPFPAITITESTGNKQTLSQEVLNANIYNYFQKMTECVPGLGNFLITFAKKN